MKLALRGVAVVAVLAAAVPLLTRADVAAQSGAAEIQLQLGTLLSAEGRWAEAYDAFVRALTAGDADTRFRARKGVVRSALRSAQFDEGASQARLLVDAAPRDPDVLALHGDAMWAVGLFDEAEASFQQALSVSPGLARGRHGAARSLIGRNKLDAALGEALVAVAATPGDPEIHVTLGHIYERMRRFEDAATEYINVLRLLPQKDRTPAAAFLRAQAAYLQTFRNTTPYELSQPKGVTLHTMPFKEVRGKIIVQGRINGGEWSDFVVDTGAERTVISRRAALRAGVASVVSTLSAGVGDVGIRGLEIGTIESLEIGSLGVRNLPCLIKNPPLTGMPSRESEAFSPLAIGLSMRVDYKQRLVTFGTGLPELPADFELPLYLNRLATVRGLVDNARPVNFVVDTGGEVISISAATARALNKPAELRRIPLKVYGTSGWEREAYLLPGVDLTFDAIRYRNQSVVVLNLDAPSVLLGYQLGGIIGHVFLSKYRVDMDLDRGVVRLKVL